MLSHYSQLTNEDILPDYRYLTVVSAGEFKRLKDAELDKVHAGKLKEYRSARKKRDVPSGPVENNLLDLKIELARRILKKCVFCEHRCGVDRKRGGTGKCGIGEQSYYTSEFLHFGEEPELVPSHTIFFSGCTFKCVYCQNWDTAMFPAAGRGVKTQQMAQLIALGRLQGSKNVNFVGGNPDSHLLTILKIIRELKIEIPVVWNSNMYASAETMSLLEGVVDLYLGDFRYGNDACALKYSGAEKYFSAVSRNFLLAAGQADVIMRHLVLPGHLECCTKEVMKWAHENMPDVYFNLMFQYQPCYRASEYPEINRRLTVEERNRALQMAREYGLKIE